MHQLTITLALAAIATWPQRRAATVLVLTAVLVGSPEAAGLVVAAKSVFRFGDIKEGRAFAEHLLIGTFLSISEAVGIGLAARYLLGHLPAA